MASVTGAISFIVGSDAILAVATAGVIILTAVAYWRAHEDDPGLTTEIALILTVVLGGLSMQQPALAAGLAVTVAVLLAARSPIHRFVRSVLAEDELKNALIFAGATLVVLPLVPDRPMGPCRGVKSALNFWILVIIMAISAVGYIAVRMLGAQFELPSPVSHQALSQAPRLSGQWVGVEDGGCSRGCSCGCGVVNDCNDRPNGNCSRRHQHDNPSSPVATIDLCRFGGPRL